MSTSPSRSQKPEKPGKRFRQIGWLFLIWLVSLLLLGGLESVLHWLAMASAHP